MEKTFKYSERYICVCVNIVRGWKKERGFSYFSSGAMQTILVYQFVESSLNALVLAYFVNSLFLLVKQGIFYDKKVC